MQERTIRLAGVAAIVFVVLTVIAVFASGSPPAADDAVGTIRDYLVDHRSALLVGNFLGLVAIPFVLWFGVALRELVRGDPTANAFGTASLLGLAVTAPMAMAGGAVASSAIYVDGAAGRLGDDSILIVFEAQNLLFEAASAGLVLFLLMAGLAIRRTRALPPYLMWLAFLAALANVVALFSTLAAGASAIGLVGVLSFTLFVLVAGIVMLVGKVVPLAGTRPAVSAT
jgi:hypothetical protein